MARPIPTLEEVVHLTLLVGRALLQSNQETELVHDAIRRTAASYGCDTHVLVTYESLIVTVLRDGEFRTKTGILVPTMTVNMDVIAQAEAILRKIESETLAFPLAVIAFENLNATPSAPNRWLVVAGMALTSGALSRLFGGDWPTFAVAFAAGFVCMLVRTGMARRGVNGFIGAFSAALAGGTVAGLAVNAGWSAMPAICFLAPGMILVPGVPLVNGIQDAIRNHLVLGLSRLAFSVFLVSAIALGLATAMGVTGILIPVSEASILPPIWQDAAFSAVAALGYSFLFNVPLRLAWVGVLCGMVSHSLRTASLGFGADIVTGSFLGALAAGILAHAFARRFAVPFAAFVFPGVVAMIPGSLAFRAMIGVLEIVKAGPSAPLPLISETLALIFTALLMVFAIATGVAVPSVVRTTKPRSHAG